jgi:hypothetical protein
LRVRKKGRERFHILLTLIEKTNSDFGFRRKYFGCRKKSGGGEDLGLEDLSVSEILFCFYFLQKIICKFLEGDSGRGFWICVAGAGNGARPPPP